MSNVVLDASAILASILEEPGYESLTPDLLQNALASTVNLAEVHGKLVSLGWSSEDAWEDATSHIHQTVAFDETQAKIAGDLSTHTRRLGLSLGDRACLALAIALQAPIYTADKAWKQLKLKKLPIHLIR